MTATQNKLDTFIKSNKLEHIVGPVTDQVNKTTGEIVGSYAYCRVGKDLILKYFIKFDNICLQLGDTLNLEFKKDKDQEGNKVPNQVFAATIKKLQTTKPVNDLAMF